MKSRSLVASNTERQLEGHTRVANGREGMSQASARGGRPQNEGLVDGLQDLWQFHGTVDNKDAYSMSRSRLRPASDMHTE